MSNSFLVANYGLAGQYDVHTDAVYITNDAASKKQMREIWNIHAGDRAVTVSFPHYILKKSYAYEHFYRVLP